MKATLQVVQIQILQHKNVVFSEGKNSFCENKINI